MLDKISPLHRLFTAVALALLLTWLGPVGGAVPSATAPNQRVDAAAADDDGAPVERGTIVGWIGGDAVIYPTLGFFEAPRIVAVGAVKPDGSFMVQYPATVPVDMLGKSTDQCPTLHSSDPAALSNFTGNSLLFQHGMPVGATHSATSEAFASFTGFADGDTRTGFLYTDRDTTISGSCERQLDFNGATVDFMQNFDLPVHKGWNEVVAIISIPQPGHVVADLTVGSNRKAEQWFFFRPAMQP